MKGLLNEYDIKDKPDKIRCNNKDIKITIKLKR